MPVDPSNDVSAARIRDLERALADSERERKALKRRIQSLTQPHETPDDIRFEDIFNIEELQRLQDLFAEACNVASIITRVDGAPITRPSHFCRLCETIIRKTDKGLARCAESDAAIRKISPGSPFIQKCLFTGLWNAGANVSVGGRHIANWLIGQVRDDTQAERDIRAHAREIGIDEAVMIDAYREVPSMPLAQFRRIAKMLFALANQLSTTAYQNLGQIHAIAERRRAEADLKESEDRLRTLIRTLPDLVWLKDQKGIFQLCNARFEAFIGAREEEIVGKTDYDLVDHDQADFFRKHDQRAITQGGPTKIEETMVFASDGHREIIETIKTPMYRRDGTLIGVLGIGRDATDRITAEKRLKKSQARYRQLYKETARREKLYRSLLESSPDAIVIYDLEGRAQYVNPAFTRIFGYSMEDVAGKRIQYLPDEVMAQSMANIQKMVLHGESMSNVATKRLTKDGRSLDVVLSSACYDDHAGNRAGSVVFLRDVTQHKQTEEQLRQAQKMESVGRLAGGVAHDFNNMLNVILGYTELEMATLDEAHPLYKSLQEIRKAAFRSTDLTRQLLAFARKQTVAPKVLDLNKILEGMLRILQRLIGEDIDLVWRPATGLWLLRMDGSQIHQLLTNLCVNSRDAISDVGKITIETANVRIDKMEDLTDQDVAPGDFVMLAVSDNGAGMDRATREKIFDPFFTTKGDRRGTGLGLSTVYGIVKQNHGFIDVDSRPGEGTTFKIYLPRYSGPETEEQDDQVDTMPRGADEVVLVVEDEAMILRLTEKMLQGLGYRVLTANDPMDALDLAESRSGDIALVIADVVMPGLNGRELVDRIKARSPAIKALFMSGYTADVIAHRGVLEDGVQFIQKPFTLKELAVRVHEAMKASPN